MSGTELATLPRTSDRAAWTEDESAVIEAAGLVFTHAYGELKGQKVLAPRSVVARFLHTCERTGLDPLARQIYCIGRFGSDGLEWSIQTAIDGFRVIAERSKKYAGQDPAQWLTEKGEWVDVFVKSLHGEHPLAARVSVYRHDWSKPVVGIATWDEYAQTTRKGDLTSMWAKRGPGQLAKCAEALAFRKAFPQDLSGIYTDDEMSNAGPVVLEEAPVPPSQRSRIQRPVDSPSDEGVEPPVDAEVVEEGSTEPEGVPVAQAGAERVVRMDRVHGRPADIYTPPEDVVEVLTFVCSNCGQRPVENDGDLCSRCEDLILAAEEEGTDG